MPGKRCTASATFSSGNWATPSSSGVSMPGASISAPETLRLTMNTGTANPDAVLNGIAWDARGKRLFVTGKLWPKLFEIELIEIERR